MAYFEKHVRPLLAERCYRCHGPDKQESDLRLDTWQGMAGGGVSGPAVVPGKLAESLLYTAVTYASPDLQMPPKKQLTAREQEHLKRWISRGAAHPNAGAEPIRPRAVDLEEGRRFWAFQPLADTPLPTIKNAGWAETEIDYFIAAKHEAAGLRPAPPADRATLLRRATFDLTGLPPTADEIARFEADRRPGAWSRVIDRLLASPQYGERWGRHWLKVARYADSNGLDENIAFGTAWRYRDYVVAAFNADMPLEQFIVEQLAGDLLPPSGDRQRDYQRLIATGFLSLGPKVLAEVDQVKMEMDIIDEQVDTVGRAFMGLTMGCARCHDHKFDPVSTRDYYALAGIFKSTRTMEHYVKIARWYEHPIPTAEEQQLLADHQQQLATLKEQIEQTVAEAQAAINSGASGEAEKVDEKAFPAAVQSALKQQRAALAKLEKAVPTVRTALGVGEREVQDLKVHVRGSHLTLGAVAPRSFPAVLVRDPVQLPTEASGRLELAKWLTSPEHPLTSRVLVNRIWRWHFGVGLCRSVDNFGRLGTLPDHPELLDWLARRLLDEGWSLKRLHRTILLSSTYRMSSRFDAENARIDPENLQLWRHRMRRLEAEEVRDALLAVSQRLDRSQGGSLLHVENREFLFNHTSKDETRYDSRRRSVYLPVIRNHLYDVFQLFDYADASVSNSERPTTTVAPQALFMLNGPMVWEAARDWAAELESTPDTGPRIQRLYREAVGRAPTEAELQRAHRYLARFADVQPPLAVLSTPTDPRPPTPEPLAPTPWEMLCHAVLASNEFIYVR